MGALFPDSLFGRVLFLSREIWGLVSTSLPHPLGYACTLYTPLSPLLKEDLPDSSVLRSLRKLNNLVYVPDIFFLGGKKEAESKAT